MDWLFIWFLKIVKQLKETSITQTKQMWQVRSVAYGHVIHQSERVSLNSHKNNY